MTNSERRDLLCKSQNLLIDKVNSMDNRLDSLTDKVNSMERTDAI